MLGWVAVLLQYYVTLFLLFNPQQTNCFRDCLSVVKNFRLLEKNVTYFEIWEEENMREYDLFRVLWQKTTPLERCVVSSVILQYNEYMKSNRWLKFQKNCFVSKQFKQNSNPVSCLHSFFGPASFSFLIMYDQCHAYSP